MTTVHDAGIGEQALKAYRELIEKDALPLRVYAMIGGPGALWDRVPASADPRSASGFTVRSIKLMADGALGSRGAALLAALRGRSRQHRSADA